MHKEETERGLSGSRAPEKGERDGERRLCERDAPKTRPGSTKRFSPHTTRPKQDSRTKENSSQMCCFSSWTSCDVIVGPPWPLLCRTRGRSWFSFVAQRNGLMQTRSSSKKNKTHRHSPHLRPNAARHQLIFYCYVFLLKGNEVARSEKGLSAGST